MAKITQDELNKLLWSAADSARGVVDGGMFKDYILAFLFYKYMSDSLKDEYVETPTKEVKSLSVYIDGKRYTSENYWDSDYNRGISLEGEELYKQHEKEVKELFNAFINLDGDENDWNWET